MPHAHAPPALVLDRYRLVRRIGSGGFGTVWLAHDEHLDRPVAVKRVPTEDEAQAERVRREALAAARVSHPGIVALYEAGADEEACYLVSELVRGETLAALEADGALSDRDVVEIGITLCEALAHAHARGVVHRDVKPGNVIVPEATEEGGASAKLTDFGIARVVGDDALTRTGDVMGTLAYMAPEQAEGRGATPASDVYALGIVLYEALAGVNPVRGATPAETARRLGEPVPQLLRARRDLPRRLCDAIDQAVEVEPEDRIPLVALRAALLSARNDVDDEPGLVTEGGVTAITQRFVRAREPVRREPAPWEEPERAAPPSRRAVLPARIGAALAAGVLAAVAVGELGAPVEPLAAGGAVAGGVLLLPRVAWLLAAATLIAWLFIDGQSGVALLVAVAVAPVPLALWHGRAGWSLPAAAPALGLIGLAVAFPALAGQARTWFRRAALGALGALWLALAESLLDERLLGGAPSATEWQDDVGRTVDVVLTPALDVRLAALAAAFAAAAAALPWLVRGRGVGPDALGAGAWAIALAAATQAALAPSNPRGLIAGAAVGGALALLARSLRPTARSEDGTNL